MDQITEGFLWRRLRPLLDYLDDEAIEKVQQALTFALSVHSGQMRKSGEPYITHPLEVGPLNVPQADHHLKSFERPTRMDPATLQDAAPFDFIPVNHEVQGGRGAVCRRTGISC